MIKGFREFILRGNVVDLAVGIVIGGASPGRQGSIDGLINPLVEAIFGRPNLSQLWTFTLPQGSLQHRTDPQRSHQLRPGGRRDLLHRVIPVNRLRARNEADRDAGPSEVELLTEIRDSPGSQ